MYLIKIKMIRNMTAAQTIEHLKSLGNPKIVEGMGRFGIKVNTALGISQPVIKILARQLKKNHTLSKELWASNIHEARTLASFIAEPNLTTEKQMEEWVQDFNSWDICDQVCGNLFQKTALARTKAIEWCHREEEFVRRAGFVMMAAIAVHHKKAEDKSFIEFLNLIEKYSFDERNFVKKAVNWALRQIGKRNLVLNKLALETAERVLKQNTKSSRWIANDAIRELNNELIIARLRKKN